MLPQDFRDLIAKVKKVYTGKITIAAGTYLVTKPVQIGFLDALDFVGIEGYFALKAPPNASLSELKQAWMPVRPFLHCVACPSAPTS